MVIVTKETLDKTLYEIKNLNEPERRHELLNMLERWLIDKSLSLSQEQIKVIKEEIEKHR